MLIFSPLILFSPPLLFRLSFRHDAACFIDFRLRLFYFFAEMPPRLLPLPFFFTC